MVIYCVYSVLIGYFTGSFPTGFLLLSRTRKIDIRKTGSGNVGAMNAYEVSGSKWIGILTMVIDMIKGIVAVVLCSLLFGSNILYTGIAGCAAIAGHNYSIWLRGKGGRGLATAAGVMLILGWIFVGTWCALWLIWYASSKHIHIANIGATILSPVVMMVTPTVLLSAVVPANTDLRQFIILCCTISAIVLLRHVEPMMALWKERNS
jgi:acyl phosphate:glycerol-3-phosphate acyltransferase